MAGPIPKVVSTAHLKCNNFNPYTIHLQSYNLFSALNQPCIAPDVIVGHLRTHHVRCNMRRVRSFCRPFLSAQHRLLLRPRISRSEAVSLAPSESLSITI